MSSLLVSENLYVSVGGSFPRWDVSGRAKDHQVYGPTYLDRVAYFRLSQSSLLQDSSGECCSLCTRHFMHNCPVTVARVYHHTFSIFSRLYPDSHSINFFIQDI